MLEKDLWDGEGFDSRGHNKEPGLFFVVFAAVGAEVVAANTYNGAVGVDFRIDLSVPRR